MGSWKVKYRMQSGHGKMYELVKLGLRHQTGHLLATIMVLIFLFIKVYADIEYQFSCVNGL